MTSTPLVNLTPRMTLGSVGRRELASRGEHLGSGAPVWGQSRPAADLAADSEAADDRRGEMFVPLRIQDTPPAGQVGAPASEVMAGSAPMSAPGMIELESGNLRVRFFGSVDASALRLVLAHFGRRG